jgi:hypothetical protein
MRLAALGLLCALPAWAGAGDRRARVPGTDLVVVAHEASIEIRRGPVSTRIPLGLDHPDLVMGVDAEVRGDAVTIAVELNCGGGREVALTRAGIEARFAADAAEAAARAGDVPAALAGTARWRRLGVAYSPALHLVAYSDHMANSMADDDRTPSTLVLIDARDGRALERRAPDPGGAADEMLAVLGLVPVAMVEVPTGDDGKTRRVLPGTKLGVVIDEKNGKARVLRGDRILGETAFGASRGYTAGRTPEGVVVGGRVNIGDGCGGWDYDTAAFIPLRCGHRRSVPCTEASNRA